MKISTDSWKFQQIDRDDDEAGCLILRGCFLIFGIKAEPRPLLRHEAKEIC